MLRRSTTLPRFVLATTFVLGFASLPAPVAANEFEELAIDTPVRGVIAWEEESWKTFTVEVPDDAIVLILEVSQAGVDLDLFARFAKPIDSYETDPDHQATSFHFNDELRISRLSAPPLRPGVYYVDVAYVLDEEPRLAKRRVREIPFTLTASLIRDRIDGELRPGLPIDGETSQSSGAFRSYVVDVPRDAKAMRIDLSGVTSDLDLRARRGRPIYSPDDADHTADSILGRETLLVDRSSDPPLVPGRWFIQVQDPYYLESVPFRAHVVFSPTAPGELLELPPLDTSARGLRRALAATVEVATWAGSGSGALLSPQGWVLTNYHVVEAEAGGVVGRGEVVLSMTLDPRMPPAELFRGRVIAADEKLDLALVKIESGLYGQPLPEGYHFPYFERGPTESLLIGDPMAVVGYPGVGGLGSRVSITLTQGVIAGFDTSDAGLLIKTDAEISSGNSGGAALDPEWRLIGIPSATVEDTNGNSQLGYVIPLDLVPGDWWERVAEAQN